MADSPLWMAVTAIKSGLSARAGLAAARAAGVQVRDSTWFRLVREARESLGGQMAEASRPLDRRPLSSETFTFSTKTQTGYLQHVQVFARVRETGEIVSRPASVVSDELLRRDDVVETVLANFIDAADRYGEQILGAAYTGTYVMVPGLE
jgi:hypothetical protein